LTDSSSQQVFTELEFYLWKVRLEPSQEWWPEIMFKGSEKALAVMRDAVQSMRDEFKEKGQSTRKFLCNPPENIDVLRLAKDNDAEIEWQIWLILRMEPGVVRDSPHEVKNKAVTVRLNDKMAAELVKVLDEYLTSGANLQEGLIAPGRLLLSLDWLGY
jgi:hypothetical protein